jgi:hypothetical protein
MKTKLPRKIFIVGGILCLCFWIAAQAQNQQNHPQAPETPEITGGQFRGQGEQEPKNRGKTLPLPGEDYTEFEEEDDFGYDQDIFSRKLFHKKLPPLSKKQKIVWAFRMAEANSLL